MNGSLCIHTRGGVWLGVSPLSCRPHQIHRLPFLLEEWSVWLGVTPLSCPPHQIQRLPPLEEEGVVGCKPAVMPSSNRDTTIDTRGGVCGWVYSGLSHSSPNTQTTIPTSVWLSVRPLSCPPHQMTTIHTR